MTQNVIEEIKLITLANPIDITVGSNWTVAFFLTGEFV